MAETKVKTKVESPDSIWIEMNTLPTMHVTNEQKKAMIAKVAKKYNVQPGKVRFTTKKIYPTGTDASSEALNSENINNIQDPKYHLELFKKYIKENGVKDYDWDELVNIDSRVNNGIDFTAYEKGRRFELKYARWKNFLSYGDNNYFDFTKLHGLILLRGEPANKSGKSTFAYDLIHFALFGKTRSGKADTKAEMFNNYRPDEREVVVELGISIDGENYVIKRTLTKPDPKKKTKNIANTVEYYMVHEGGENEKLQDVENLNDASTTKTTKAIKEAIGSEEDFDRIISANAKDLDELISMKDTDRGRVLSRWIGLLPIEDKEAKAKEMWARESVGRTCDMYDRETLKSEIEALKVENETSAATIESNKAKIEETKNLRENDMRSKDILLSSKQKVDDSLLHIDVTTVEAKIKQIIENGKKNNETLSAAEKELEEYGDVEYNDDDYKTLQTKRDAYINQIAQLKAEMKAKKKEAESLANDEYCPTCGQKWPNKDNSKAIEQLKKEYDEDYQKGIQLKAEQDKIIAQMDLMEDNRKKHVEKGKKELKVASLKVNREKMLAEYTKFKKIADDYKENKDTILKNNEIDTQVNVLKTNIETYDGIIRRLESENVASQKDIEVNNGIIKEKETNIKKIEKEVETEKNWRLYLQMIGKDGISKIVLKQTLPLINGELDNLLCDVADFGVEVEVNERNDVEFWLVRDNVKTRLSAGSGLEKTMASLALRVVLGKMSNLSKPPFIVLDEIMGSVAKENYDDMKKLYDKISQEYDYILHICHIDLDWYDSNNVITVVKENNISKIVY